MNSSILTPSEVRVYKLDRTDKSRSGTATKECTDGPSSQVDTRLRSGYL